MLPAGSAGWHLSSLTCGPTASHRPFLAPCQLPAPRPLTGTASPGRAGSREERTGSLGPLTRPSRAPGCSPAPRVKPVFELVLVSWTPSR